ncbi:MAG: hypothetical protein WBB28_01920 [Crinalium sp.]
MPSLNQLEAQKSLVDLLRSPDAFIEWVNSFPGDSQVGLAYSSCGCPVAKFLKDSKLGEFKIQEAEVYPRSVTVWVNGREPVTICDLPRWLQETIVAIDNYGQAHNRPIFIEGVKAALRKITLQVT